YGLGNPVGQTKVNEIQAFRNFYFHENNNTELSHQVPFSPSVRCSQHLTWQANDPLVHYTAGDLAYLDNPNGGLQKSRRLVPEEFIPILPNIGHINNRYSPWGGKEG